MSWRDNALVLEALAEQGYRDEDGTTLRNDLLAASVCDVFLRNPIPASQDDILDKKARLVQIGLSNEQLLDAVFPGFRETHELSDEERQLLAKNPKDNPELEERSNAISTLATLVWGTIGKTGRQGAAQKLIVQRELLLIETKPPVRRDGVSVTLKAATDDPDLIIEYYVRPRGDQLVRVSGGVRDDCAMVGMTFDALIPRMKAELGVHVTSAMSNLMQVAAPDLSVLTAGNAKQAKALGSSAQKS